MPTGRQESDFASEMNGYTEVNRQALRAATEWIADNLSPEDVFDNKKLSAWAEENGYAKE